MKPNIKKFIFLSAAGTIVTSCALSLTSCSWNKGSVVRLVTDSGAISDKSFNESAYNSLEDIMGTKSPRQNTWYRPQTNLANSIANGYRAAEATGAKYILAPGFYHVAAVQKYCEEQKNSQLHWILADADGSLDSPSGHKLVGNRVSGIIFNMKLTSYMGGFYSAYRAQEFDKPMVGTYGGGDFPGVTDYNLGWLAGVKGANAFNLASHNSAWKSVGVAKFASAESWTDSGFESVSGAIQKTKVLLAKGANVIMPVAGNETSGTLKAITETGKNAIVLGVDTDMSLQYPSYKKYFFTSILKNVTFAMDAIYLKDVENINVINSKSTNTAAKGAFSRFGGKDAGFVDKKGNIDLTNSNIKPFGTNTFGAISNHFTGMSKLNWKGTKKTTDVPKAMAYLALHNSVAKKRKH